MLKMYLRYCDFKVICLKWKQARSWQSRDIKSIAIFKYNYFAFLFSINELMKFKQEVSNNLGVCFLNLQIEWLTRPRDKKTICFYGRKLLIACNHPARFGSHRNCSSGDKMFLIYSVTSCDHMFKGMCDLMGWIFLKQVTISPSLVAIDLVVVVIQLLK